MDVAPHLLGHSLQPLDERIGPVVDQRPAVRAGAGAACRARRSARDRNGRSPVSASVRKARGTEKAGRRRAAAGQAAPNRSPALPPTCQLTSAAARRPRPAPRGRRASRRNRPRWQGERCASPFGLSLSKPVLLLRGEGKGFDSSARTVPLCALHCRGLEPAARSARSVSRVGRQPSAQMNGRTLATETVSRRDVLQPQPAPAAALQDACPPP